MVLRSKVCFVAVAMTVACSVVKNQTKNTIIFSHRIHSEQKLSCDDCHIAAPDDSTKQTKTIPKKPECGNCHDIESKENCAACHRNSEAPESWTARKKVHLVFSHEAHEKYGVICDDCHQGAANWPDLEGRERKGPQHADCAYCHKQHFDKKRCTMCHE